MFVFFGTLLCNVSSEWEESQCLSYNVERQARQPLVPFLTPSVWHVQVLNPRPPAPEEDALPLELSGPVSLSHSTGSFYEMV